MGGSKQPYIYQPVSYPNFNPRAHTQSLATPIPQRPVQNGPLLNFNRHPDSYDISPYGRSVGIAPMSSKSKKGIVWMRKVQLGGRVLQLLAALAVLVCVITIKGAPDTQGWILRLPPAFDIVVAFYAIWHLARPAVSRPPASSSSYHAFALLMDIGFIPFYAFTATLTLHQYKVNDGTGGWTSLFKAPGAGETVLHIAWLIAAVCAGLHAVSLFIDVYLVMMFRKIASLPPDMNPLEDNLTSRTKSKHKYKNSDMSALVGNDKRFSEISSRSANTADPLNMSQTSEKLMGDQRSSGVSFFKSRTAHDNGYSPHNPDTVQSWHIEDPNIYKDPAIYGKHGRNSRADLDRNLSVQTYAPSPITSAMPNMPQISKRNSAFNSPIVVYDEVATYDEHAEDNWEVVDPSSNHMMRAASDFDPYRASSDNHRPYTPTGQASEYPLRMNPPSPEPLATSPLSRMAQGYADKENSQVPCERSETILSTSSSSYSESAPAAHPTTEQKPRFYTDLAAAMRGVRQTPDIKPPQSVAGSVHTHLSASTNASRGGAMPAVAGDRRVKPSGTVVKKPLKNFEEVRHTGYTVGKASPSRVISRSGADVDVQDFGGDLSVRKGRRDVSGKVAEEGRGGLWRRISGQVTSR